MSGLGHLGDGKLGIVGIGSHSSVDGKFTLAEEVFKVVEQANAHRVLHVKAFNAGQVASTFSHTLTDAHDAVVKESSGVAVCSKGITET